MLISFKYNIAHSNAAQIQYDTGVRIIYGFGTIQLCNRKPDAVWIVCMYWLYCKADLYNVG